MRQMKELRLSFIVVFTAMGNILRRFFRSDDDIMHPLGRRILSNKIDAENYIKAIEESRRTGKNVNFTLENGMKITILSQ